MKFNVNDVIKTKSNLYKVVSSEGGLYKVECIKFLEVEDLGDGIICHSIGCEIWVSDFICWKFELVNKEKVEMKLTKQKDIKVLFNLLETTDHVQILTKVGIKWIAMSVFSGYPHDISEDLFWISSENNIAFSDIKEFYILDK